MSEAAMKVASRVLRCAAARVDSRSDLVLATCSARAALRVRGTLRRRRRGDRIRQRTSCTAGRPCAARSTRATCYPAPAAIHGSLSSDKERLKLCLRVQTPAPILGRTSRNRSGHPGCAGGASPRGGDRSPTPQPPTSSNRCGSRRTHPNPVVGITPLRSLGARSILETAPRGAVPDSAPHTAV